MDELVNTFGALDLNEKSDLDLITGEYEQLGAHYMNRAGTNTKSDQFWSRFVAKFGSSPRVFARVWQLLETEQSPLPQGLLKKHLLWLMNFCKEYPSIRSIASSLGGIDEHTASKWLKVAGDEVLSLSAVVVSLESSSLKYISFLVTHFLLFLHSSLPDRMGKSQ